MRQSAGAIRRVLSGMLHLSPGAPAFCHCRGGEFGQSTHHGAAHMTSCKHSEMARTTKRYRKQEFKRLPGTRGVTVVLDGGR